MATAEALCVMLAVLCAEKGEKTKTEMIMDPSPCVTKRKTQAVYPSNTP